MGRYSNAQLKAERDAGNPWAEMMLRQREHVARLIERAEIAEREARDVARELDRLKGRLAVKNLDGLPGLDAVALACLMSDTLNEFCQAHLINGLSTSTEFSPFDIKVDIKGEFSLLAFIYRMKARTQHG